MSKPIIAIVGRPNVGKSTLFNRILGDRISIVEDTPGVTRDRIYGEAEWLDRRFMLIDTGGLEPYSKDEILSKMRLQAELAIESADVIIFLTDIKTGMTATDQEIAAMLLKSQKPIVLACNKTDQPGSPPLELYEFYNLGLGEPIPISSTHGMGLGDLLDAAFAHLPDTVEEDDDDDVIKVAVIGKPNAGKSSLINRIVGEERVIVSNIPGTTRDAIDTPFEKNGQKYLLIDTAGMRKRGKIEENIERYSVIRSLMAIDRADVCVMMIDATEGVTEQDTKIAGYAHEQGKGMIVAVNKWDLLSKENGTFEEYTRKVYEGFAFMQYAKVLCISALTGQRVEKLFELIRQVAEKNAMRISTGLLNDVLNECQNRVQPPTDKGRRLKIFYITQASTKPPTFVLFVNDRELAHFSYVRYIENRIRETFALDGTPVRFIIRERERDGE